MKQLPLYIASILVLITTCLSPVAYAQSDLKIGFVNIQKIMQEAQKTSAIKEKIAAVQKEFKERAEKIKAIQNELQSLRDQASKQGLTMSQADRIELQEKMLKKDREYRWLVGISEEDEKMAIQSVQRSVEVAARKAVYTLAKKEKYDLVLMDGVLFNSKRIDLTDKVLKALAQ